MYYINNYLAVVYGGGKYATNVYSSSGDSSTASSAGSSLTNTGFDITLIITIASVILLAAVLVRFWKRPSKNL